jgi:hypothetical protein
MATDSDTGRPPDVRFAAPPACCAPRTPPSAGRPPSGGQRPFPRTPGGRPGDGCPPSTAGSLHPADRLTGWVVTLRRRHRRPRLSAGHLPRAVAPERAQRPRAESHGVDRYNAPPADAGGRRPSSGRSAQRTPRHVPRHLPHRRPEPNGDRGRRGASTRRLPNSNAGAASKAASSLARTRSRHAHAAVRRVPAARPIRVWPSGGDPLAGHLEPAVGDFEVADLAHALVPRLLVLHQRLRSER